MAKSPSEFIYWEQRTRRHLARKTKFYDPKKVPRLKVLGYTYVRAPTSFDIYSEETYEITLDFINQVVTQARLSKVMLDFSETEQVTAAAVLFLFAQIDTFLIENKNSRIRIKADSLKGLVKRTILLSGLIDLTLNKPQITTNGSRYSLPVTRGTAEGEEFEDVVTHIVKNIYKSDDPEAERIIGSAVSETVGNVKLHAYPTDTVGFKPWWMICSVIDDSLYMAIYDIGVGIPKTIHSTPWIRRIVSKTPKLMQKWSSSRDTDLIDLSMEVGQTQTKLRKHGKGSKSIQALVSETPKGQLWIFSNKGLLKESPMYSKQLIEHDTSIGGTLVQWNIKIRDEKTTVEDKNR
ncbi:MAG: hypothetical protein COA51_04920 [Idiomarina sp.]|nr:MAG: hypothetical protein COA51_04920 [Idiomarina sp.]